jgi:pimeloyl-ACP methyl ester carboxylesterase
MKLLVKTLKILGITFLILIAGFIIFIFFTGPQLPDNTDSVIEKVINSKLPEYVHGKTGYVVSDSLKIWYESIPPKAQIKGTIILFMGISNDALAWPQKFLDEFTSKGYRVIRFDYRGTGMSDWDKDWKKKPYSLSELAKDAVSILDTLKIDKAHILGVSLGGMVAQEFVIKYPERTLSLTSIMSSGNIIDPELPPLSKLVVLKLVKNSIKYGLFNSEKNMIKLHITSFTILRGNAHYELNVEGIAGQVLYDIRKRRGYNPEASAQQQDAVLRSGSRYARLKDIKVPALIIHGKNDPFIPIEHSKKLAKIIPNAQTIWYENMGHDLPDYLIPEMVKDIILFMEKSNKQVIN